MNAKNDKAICEGSLCSVTCVCPFDGYQWELSICLIFNKSLLVSVPTYNVYDIFQATSCVAVFFLY